MKRIEIIYSEEAFENLKTFKDVDEMNLVVRQYKDAIKEMDLRKDVKENLLTVIEHLKRYSCSFFGVSFMRKREIAKEIGMSYRSVIRLCQRLESFGFIKQYAMKRSSDMYQTVNAIVVQPIEAENSETVRQEAAEVSRQENKTSLKQEHIFNNTYAPQPLTFYQRFKSFVNNVNSEDETLASRMYGVYRGQTAALLKNDAYDKEDIESLAISALHAAVMTSKTRRIRNLPGFFNGVISRMIDRYIDDIIEQESVPLTEPLPTWLA